MPLPPHVASRVRQLSSPERYKVAAAEAQASSNTSIQANSAGMMATSGAPINAVDARVGSSTTTSWMPVAAVVGVVALGWLIVRSH